MGFIIGFIAGALTAYFVAHAFYRNLIQKNLQVENKALELMRKIAALWKKYLRLYSIIKKLRLEYVEEMQHTKLLEHANLLLRDKIIKENSKTIGVN
jgi:uncharacterized membrane-anchored protein YhcB (DUF1043 family)